jgi:hypothetical protein
MRIVHLPCNLSRDVCMPRNAFYIGEGISNLPKSNLYQDQALSMDQYKRWLWEEIKLKSIVYQELLIMRDIVIKGDELILVCSCNKENCPATTIKKALRYLIAEEKASCEKTEASWPEYFAKAEINEDSQHNFSCWLSANNYLAEKLNFNELWINYVLIQSSIS